jgi:hypothetical protein
MADPNQTTEEPRDLFTEGLEAYHNGRDVSDCPYPDATTEQAEWTAGWYTAKSRARL